MNELNRQLISMYAKQLRVPTFNQYEEVIRQLDGDKGFDDFLVSLMRVELENRRKAIANEKFVPHAFHILKHWRSLIFPIWSTYLRLKSINWPAATLSKTSRISF